MIGAMTVVTILVGILLFILVAGLFVAGGYNALVQLRNQTKNALSQVDVQLKRRHDLIPNLVEATKGYMTHERETLEAVIQARQQAISITDSSSAQEHFKAENHLSNTLRSLFAVAENYPDLKANENFLALQEELVSTENKIGFARQFYNDCVLNFNNQIEMFPNNLIASLFHFEQAAFFEIEEASEREAPKVSF